MSKHTPGPWKLIEEEDPEVISYFLINIGEYTIPLFPYKREYSDDKTQSGFIKCHRKLADARLIAAAPDLLEALLQMQAASKIRDPEFNADLWLNRVDAAIEKATREEP